MGTIACVYKYFNEVGKSPQSFFVSRFIVRETTVSMCMSVCVLVCVYTCVHSKKCEKSYVWEQNMKRCGGGGS